MAAIRVEPVRNLRGEVCPVKIEIPKLLLKLREEVTDAKRREGRAEWNGWHSGSGLG